jgi:alpha-1,3-mannosylglycoprotein beta-1,4-N-acetylglucosaminyltransferase A/B
MFGKYIEMGVLDVISPPPEFYPNMTNLKLSLGDKLERVQWRSKQVKNQLSFYS